MGDIAISPATLPSPNLTPIVHHTPVINLLTFDELLLERAADEDQVPLIAYPKTKHGVDDYELFNGAQLNRLVDGAVKALLKEGVDPAVRIFLSDTESIADEETESTKIKSPQSMALQTSTTSSPSLHSED